MGRDNAAQASADRARSSSLAELREAQAEMAQLWRESREVIRIMTAEEALKAQRVVREAGRK